MPLFDFRCDYCDHAFVAIAKAGAATRCPRCLFDVPSVLTAKAAPIVVAARVRGASEGQRARDGDDLEQYARQYGSDYPSQLASDYWFSVSKEIARTATDQGVEWTSVEEVVGDAYREGFIAACGDRYDDDDKEDD